jgi:hypothetical protein
MMVERSKGRRRKRELDSGRFGKWVQYKDQGQHWGGSKRTTTALPILAEYWLVMGIVGREGWRQGTVLYSAVGAQRIGLGEWVLYDRLRIFGRGGGSIIRWKWWDIAMTRTRNLNDVSSNSYL